MRALALLLLLASCDRVFGLGDPYEDARVSGSGDAPAPDAPVVGGDATGSSGELVYFPLDGNLNEAGGRGFATCMKSTGGTCAYGQSHNGSGASLAMDGTTCMSFTMQDQPATVTIAMWALPQTGATEPLVVRSYQADVALPDSWRIEEDNDSIQWTTTDGGASNVESAGSANAFQSGAWHHVAVTATTTKHEIYIDGQLKTASTGGAVDYAGGMTVYIGCAPQLGDSNGHFSGEVDEIHIYSRELSVQDIEALAQ